MQKFYHGTSSQCLAAIAREGIKPHGSVGCDQWARRRKWRYVEEDYVRVPSVYLTDVAERAKEYALIAKALYPGSEAVLLTIEIAEETELYRDELDKIAWRFPGVIPPHWIKDRSVVAGLQVKG